MSEEQNESVELPDRTDYDSPWKKALEVYFKEFIRFFFPDIATDVNWSRKYIFLDKELQQVVGEMGRTRRVHKSICLRCHGASQSRRNGRGQ